MTEYRTAYNAILEAIAERLDKPVRELVGWQDYDPILVDENARRILSPGIRFAGD